MFKKLRIALVAAVCLMLALPVSAETAVPISVEPTSKVTIQLVHTNDVHGRYGDAGQMLNLSTWIKDFKKTNPNTFVLDAGDFVQGQPVVNRTEGLLGVQMQNVIGYNYVTLGNHEFDFGNEALQRNLRNYKAKVLQANITDAKTGKYIYQRYAIEEVEGIKIGFFGLVGTDTAYKSDPEIMASYKIIDPIIVGKEMVKELKAKGCDVIVAITHLGVSDEGFNNSKDLSTKVPGINVIIDGHSHTNTPSAASNNTGTALISQNAGNMENGARYVTITIDKESKRKEFKSTLIPASELKTKAMDPIAKAVFDKEYNTFKVYGSEVVAKTTVDLNGARVAPYNSVRSYEMNLGNLIADAYLDSAKSDLAVINGGNVRTSIPTGNITREQVLTVQPFANAIVVAELTGEKILKMFEQSISNFPKENGGFLHLAGGSFKFDSTKPAGSRITEFLIGGKAIDPAKKYEVAIPDFTLKGGDNYTMLVGTPQKRTLAKVDSELVMDYLEAKGTVAPAVEGRIVDIAKK